MFKKLRGNIMLLITAIIWGSAFVAQSEGMNYVQPFTYNAVRSVIGGIVLIPVIIVFSILKKRSKNKNGEEAEGTKDGLKTTVIGGIFCGVVLFIASSLQQFGISMTTTGKAGFITALYIIIVPIIGFFLKKKTPKKIWFCAVVAIVGFYFLCINSGFSVSTGDLMVLGCAFFFSLHIMTIDHFNSKNADGMLMSCIQFFVSGALATIAMFIFEQPTVENILAAKLPILYAGILSSGVAYTLQIIGQKDTNPTVATMIMSLESVFAALSGWLILSETLSLRELAGCALVFAAVIFAQLPSISKKNKKSGEKT